MKIGFSLSPGGLLLPYHLGALATLKENGYLHDQVPVAGSSAGAIATMSVGCGIEPERVLEATIAISDTCLELGGARGRLLPLLNQQMELLVDEQAFAQLQARPAPIGLAYTQVFPKRRSYLQTRFENRDDLFRATSFSCMFPFFSTNYPCILDYSESQSNKQEGLFNSIPRVMVDGFFSVPRDRFGCPDFDLLLERGGGGDERERLEQVLLPDADIVVDRTVAICCFPQSVMGITAFETHDCISPEIEDVDLLDAASSMSGATAQEENEMARLFRLATQSSSRKELTQVYEDGRRDAEKWCRQEDSNQQKQQQQQLQERRRDE
jgi:hypothetical protein